MAELHEMVKDSWTLRDIVRHYRYWEWGRGGGDALWRDASEGERAFRPAAVSHPYFPEVAVSASISDAEMVSNVL